MTWRIQASLVKLLSIFNTSKWSNSNKNTLTYRHSHLHFTHSHHSHMTSGMTACGKFSISCLNGMQHLYAGFKAFCGRHCDIFMLYVWVVSLIRFLGHPLTPILTRCFHIGCVMWYKGCPFFWNYLSDHIFLSWFVVFIFMFSVLFC